MHQKIKIDKEVVKHKVYYASPEKPIYMNYKILMEHYEKCLKRYGDTNRGVDWPNKHDASIRYNVMIDITKSKKKVYNK